MRVRSIILFFLVLFRVLVMPAWFSFHAASITDNAKAYDQVKLHKRRSLVADDITEGHMVSTLAGMECNADIPRNILKVALFFRQLPSARPIILFIGSCQDFLHFYQYLFLKNRMLRL